MPLPQLFKEILDILFPLTFSLLGEVAKQTRHFGESRDHHKRFLPEPTLDYRDHSPDGFLILDGRTAEFDDNHF